MKTRLLLAILAVGSVSAARVLMTKSVTTDDECFINVEWTWNPEVIGDVGSHDSANWKVLVSVVADPLGPQVVVNATHKSKCHPEDADGAETWASQFALPAAGAATVVKTGSVKHPAGAETHSDTYTFEFTHAAAPAGNKLWVYGYHSKPDAHYCVSQANSLGCLPQIDSSGFPSATHPDPYVIRASQELSNKNGLLFYGFAPFNMPFQGGILCVAPPVRRTPVQSSGGNPPPDDCSGSFAFDMNAYIQSGFDPQLQPGVDVFTQYWSRDPASAPGTNLTNALTFRILP